MGAEHGAWPECRHKEHLAQAAFDAFRANAVPFWAGQKAAKALHATFNSYSFRQKFVAWQQWAEKRILLRDRLKLACIAMRRTTLMAGVLSYKYQHVLAHHNLQYRLLNQLMNCNSRQADDACVLHVCRACSLGHAGAGQEGCLCPACTGSPVASG